MKGCMMIFGIIGSIFLITWWGFVLYKFFKAYDENNIKKLILWATFLIITFR